MPIAKGHLDPRLFAGLVFLAAANVVHFYLQRSHVNEDGSDFIFGALMGIAFGLLIWALIANRHR